jgi:opacity protein-like surface antigen
MRKVFSFEVWLALALGFVLFGVGCANDTIRLREGQTVIPAGRVVWQATPTTGTPQHWARFSGLSVDGEVSHTSGKDDRSIAPGEQITLRKTTFSGPTEFRSRAKIMDASLEARAGLAIQDWFRFEPTLGIGLSSVNLEVSSGGLEQSDVSTDVGLLVGMRTAIKPHELIEFYASWKIGFLGGSSGSSNSNSVARWEAGARLLPLDHIGVFAAYRESIYTQARDEDESDAQLSFRGPVLGVELRF